MLYYVYITTNTTKSVFYSGMTNDLRIRMREHRIEKGKWKHFAGSYYCHKLIYYEIFETASEAIEREKITKNLSREKKMELIYSKNPNMMFYLIW